jgi:hypothetical protein
MARLEFVTSPGLLAAAVVPFLDPGGRNEVLQLLDAGVAHAVTPWDRTCARHARDAFVDALVAELAG